MKAPASLLSDDELLAEMAELLDEVVADAELAEAVAHLDGFSYVERARELVAEARGRG